MKNMMKGFLVVLAAGLLMFTILTPAFSAGEDINIGIDNETNIDVGGGDANAEQKQKMKQKQAQQQGQKQKNVNVINNPGDMPVAQTHGIGLSGNQTGEYGHTITQSSIEKSAMLFCGMTGVELGTMIQVMDEEGTDSWDSVSGKVKSHPFIRQRFSPLGNSDKIYLPSGEISLQLLRAVNSSQLVGGWFYDTKFNKDNAVLAQHLQMQVQIHAAKMGANVVIAIDQFDQRYFVPETFEASISGILSWIAKCFTSGGSVGGSAGVGMAQNTMYVRPGAAFIFLRIAGATDEICYQSTTVVTTKCDPSIYIERIKKAEYEISICLRYGHNNLFWRREAAKANVDAYICTGKREYLIAAINHYEMAELNYIHGYDIRKYSDSNAIIAEVEYGLASAIYARDKSIDNFWHPPEVVVHENKKTRADKPVAVTAHEKQEVLKIRRTLERYAKKLTL